MLRLAVANLIQNKTRLLLSVGGAGLALTLVFFFGAVFAGAQSRLTVYIDQTGADIWVAQAGVRTMHMSASALPSATLDQVQRVQGVGQAVPILYATDMIQAEGNEYIAYVFGVPPAAPFGGPWRVIEGSTTPGLGELIIDHAIAARAGLRIGDQVTVLGQPLRIAGLLTDTASLASSVAFVNKEDFARVRGGGEVISFVLVRVRPNESVATVAARIDQAVGGVTVQTQQQFAAEERKLVQDMSADVISIMNTAGYLTGLAVVMLTIYIATVARRREYGVLKAMGTRNRTLYQIVVIQSLLSTGLGLVASVLLTLLLALLIPRFNEMLVLALTTMAVLRVTAMAMILAGVAALLPVRQIAGLEPAAVVRRR